MEFDLQLQEERVKPHHVTTLHLVCSLAYITAGAIIYVYNFQITWWGLLLLCLGIALLGITIFANRWLTNIGTNRAVRMAELAISGIVAAYAAYQQWKFPTIIFGGIVAAVVFSLYWERRSDSQLTVRIADEGLQLPVTSRKRFLPWTEVEQVMVRFGTLTIECTDNRLFQWNLAALLPDNKILEDYCTAQVEEHRGKRRNDDW